MNALAYWILFGVVSTVALLDSLKLRQKTRSYLISLITLFLILFAGLRGDIDNDHQNYIQIFTGLSTEPLKDVVFSDASYAYSYVEPGFRLFTSLVARLFVNPQSLFMSCAVISIGLISLVFKKLSPYPLVSLLLYAVHAYLYRDLTQIRAGLAASICLLSLIPLQQKNNYRFFSLFIIAVLIHTAAAVFVLVPIFRRFKLSSNVPFLTSLLIICFLIGAFFPFGKLVSNFLPGGDLFAKLQMYTNSRYAEALGITNLTLLKQLFFSFLGLVYLERVTRRHSYFKLFLQAYVLSTCWLAVFNDFGIIGGRVATFLSVPEVILIPMIVETILSKRQWLYPVVFVSFTVYALIFFYINTFQRELFRPYYFFFQEGKANERLE